MTTYTPGTTTPADDHIGGPVFVRDRPGQPWQGPFELTEIDHAADSAYPYRVDSGYGVEPDEDAVYVEAVVVEPEPTAGDSYVSAALQTLRDAAESLGMEVRVEFNSRTEPHE